MPEDKIIPVGIDNLDPVVALGADDLFSGAMRYLRKILEFADARQNPEFLVDVKKAIEVLSRWDGKPEVKESIRRQQRVQELRRGR